MPAIIQPICTIAPTGELKRNVNKVATSAAKTKLKKKRKKKKVFDVLAKEMTLPGLEPASHKSMLAQR